MSDQYLQIKEKTDFSAAVCHLETLIECLKHGSIYLSHNRKSIHLKPQTPVCMEIDARTEPDHLISNEKINLKLHWEILESWPQAQEIFSINRRDMNDFEPSDLKIFFSKPSDPILSPLHLRADTMTCPHLKVKLKAPLTDVIRHLESLLASLREGQLFIRRHNKVVALKPYDPVTLELVAEAKLEKDSLREKLVIELKWISGETTQMDNDSFIISPMESASAL